MTEEKKQCSHEYNDKIFAAIKRLEGEIAALKSSLKPLELKKNLSLAECNARSKRKQPKPARKAAAKAKV